MNNLLESSSIEDGMDSETSITPSPVPSLTDVLRSNGKLEPGLAAKPPLPPVGLACRREHKSLDDIINIKFQRWFPESVQESYAESVDELRCKTESNVYGISNLKGSKSSENLSDFRNSSRTPETQMMLNYPMQFEAYESPRLDSGKKLPRTHTMETIHEGDDHSSQERVQANASNFSPKKETSGQNGSNDFLQSKIGQSLNKYFDESEQNSQKKRVTILETIENGERRNSLPNSENSKSSVIAKEHLNGEINTKISNNENHCTEKKFRDSNNLMEKFEFQLNGETFRTGMGNEDILSWMGNSGMVNIIIIAIVGDLFSSYIFSRK